jgi:vitamin B12 transporter
VGASRQRDRLRLALYRHRLDRDSPGVAPALPPFLERTTYTRWQLGWSRPVATRPGLRIDVGAGLDRERGDSDSELLLPPEFGGNIDGAYTVSRTTPGVFVELVAERGRWLFEAGARVDDPKDESIQFSPRIGVAWRLPGDTTRLRLSAGRAFKLPSFFAQFSPSALGGNEDLDPEIAVGADLGVEQSFVGARLTTTATVFNYRYSDLIDFDFDTFVHLNRDEVRSRGVELSAAWQPLESFGLHAALTRQDVDNLGDDAPIRHRPDWVGGLRLTWRPGDRWTWLVDAQGLSKRFDQQIPVPSRETVAGYAVWGTALRYRSTGRWELQARVDNLADRDYEAAIGFPGAGRAVRLDLAWR